eukprot:5689250-Amphidinium_carterae.2
MDIETATHSKWSNKLYTTLPQPVDFAEARVQDYLSSCRFVWVVFNNMVSAVAVLDTFLDSWMHKVPQQQL